jgi:uncharacterized protein YktA (UPF0223 family)
MFNVAYAQKEKEEEKQIRKFFLENYKKNSYKVFQGKIEQNQDTIVFDNNKRIILLPPNNYLNILLINGIFNPEVIFGKDIEEEDKISHREVTISNFEEINFFRKNPKVKRFKFLLWSEEEMNPIVCFVEFINKQAHRRTNTEIFLRGSKFSFFATAWVQI